MQKTNNEMRQVRHTKKPDTTRNSPGLEEKIEQRRRLEEGRKAAIVRENKQTIRIILNR